MLKISLLCFIFCTSSLTTFCQHKSVKRKDLFLNDSVINIQFTTDIKKLKNSKKKPEWQPADVVMHFGDSLNISEQIRVELRGNYRKEHCEMASLMLDFKTKTSPLLSDLKKLKLVGGCHENVSSEELVLKEYLVYKLYNILSPMSFRVRLLRITYNDTQKKIKPYTQYAFLIEDIQDLAKRNNCKEITKKAFGAETTNRQQITFVSIFQYMIGNTDWSLPNYHNIKMIVPLTDTLAPPYPVPYDFDYCGIVNAPYATPREDLDITTVRDRYYLGYKRTIEELKSITSVYNENHDKIVQCINDFDLLSKNNRKDIAGYVDKFFEVTKYESTIRFAFIANAFR
jgi:hypothetical protein